MGSQRVGNDSATEQQKQRVGRERTVFTAIAQIKAHTKVVGIKWKRGEFINFNLFGKPL